MDATKPILQSLGDSALLVRFADRLDDAANCRAIALAKWLRMRRPTGVTEIVPSLVSVLLRYNPRETGFETLSGELRLALSLFDPDQDERGVASMHTVAIVFGGSDGPDLDAASSELGLSKGRFIDVHNTSTLRVMAVGFAPGFVYCGMHPDVLHLPRKKEVRPLVPAGSVLFAAGQTAIAATPIPTGWYVIGRTDLRNFQPETEPPVLLQPGDMVRFEARS